MGNVGSEYGYRLLEGSECFTAVSFPSNPILFGSVPNRDEVKDNRNGCGDRDESREIRVLR